VFDQASDEATPDAAAPALPVSAFAATLASYPHEFAAESRAGVVLTPVEGRAILNLRCVADDPGVPAAVMNQLGLTLPLKVFGSAADASDQMTALWIGPGDWLVTCAEPDKSGVAALLRASLAGARGALIDVGHGYAVLHLSGPNAPDVLAQGCSLDLHPEVFIAGHCAMTGVAKLRAVIHRLPRSKAGPGGYDVYVARSVAGNLWHFATTAAMEYGYQVQG